MSQPAPTKAPADAAPIPQYIQYDPSQEAHYLPAIRQLISKDLSEPYSIYVYRYFLYQWGHLCYMVLFFSFPFPTIPSTTINVVCQTTIKRERN